MTTIELSTPTASCTSCRDRIAAALSDIDGVESATLDLATKRTTVVYDPAKIDRTAIATALDDAGYPPEA